MGETGNLGKGLERRRKLGEKNKHKSKMRVRHSWTRSAHVGEARGKDNSEKLEKRRICNLRTGDPILMKFDV